MITDERPWAMTKDEAFVAEQYLELTGSTRCVARYDAKGQSFRVTLTFTPSSYDVSIPVQLG
jgi:hypothetical protein